MEAVKQDYIFISYSRDDSSIVDSIVKEMKDSGYNVWYDKKIPVGKNWLNSLASHIKRCTVCVAFHSHTSRDSKYCQREIHYALKKEKPVFSVYLTEDVTLEDWVDFLLSPYQSVRYTDTANLLETLRQNPDFERCRGNTSDAPKKRNDAKQIVATLKKDAQSLFRIVSAVVAFLLSLVILALLWHYAKRTPIWYLDKGGVLDIGTPPLPLLQAKMTDYYSYESESYSEPLWETSLVQFAVIRKGVTYIGASSFQDCFNMKFVSISEGVTAMGVKAFSGCTKLQEINFPSSLDVVSSEAFYGCTGLKEIHIHRKGKTKRISSYAFYGCSGLESVSFPSSVTYIEAYAFFGCTSLTQIQFYNYVKEQPIGIRKIGDMAFSNCIALDNIVIPESIHCIGRGAFSNCSNLKTVRIRRNRKSVTIVEDEGWDSISNFAPDTLYISATAFDPDTEIIYEPPVSDADISDSD